MNAPVSVPELVDMLVASAEDVTHRLFPDARFTPSRAQVGSLAGEPGQSLSIFFRGSKPGNWEDFATGERGDILDLIRMTLFEGDKGEAVRWALAFLGLSDADPAAIQTRRREAERRVKAASKQAEQAARRKRARAWSIWGREARQDLAGTPVEAYLAGRGIALSRVPSTGALRYHPELLYRDEGDPADGTFYDAMVAAVVSPAGDFLAVHRTYLEQDAAGAWRKADVRSPKKVLGASEGGYISICKGASGKTMAAMPEGERIEACEGIEDALTLAMAMPDRRIVASVSVSNLPAIAFPPAAGRICWWRDNDVHPDAVRGYERAAEAMAARPCPFFVVELPAGVKDVNELLTDAIERSPDLPSPAATVTCSTAAGDDARRHY